MPRARRGMFRDPRYRGWLWRDRRGGRDVWHTLGENFAEACAEYDRLRGQAPADASRAYVRDVAEEWLAIDVEERRVASGRKQLRGNVDRYLVPFLGTVRLCDLNDDHCRRYAAHLKTVVSERTKRPFRPWQIRKLLDELCRMLNWCEQTKRVARSPFPKRLKPRIPRGDIDGKVFTDEEVAILCALPGKLGFLCRWGLESMLAWSDLVRSTAAMIDDKGILCVTRAKTGQISLVPVSRAMREEIRLRIGPLVTYSPKSGGSAMNAIKRKSGIKGFTFHRLRHTGATLRIRAGWSTEEVALMLGHTNVTTTQIYARASRRMLEEKAARMPAQSAVNAEYLTVVRDDEDGATR